MFLIYNICLLLAALLLSPVIAAAFIIQPKFRAGFFEKLGVYSFKKNGKKTAVFHCVSAGETNAAAALIKEYKKLHPDENIIVTAATRTGHELQQKLFSDTAEKIVYFPYDFFFSVLSFFNTFKPDKVIIAETEIWPAFLRIAKLSGIKTYIINGRISPNSYKGYKKIKMFISPVLNCFEKIYMQSKDDAARIIDIGAAPDKTEVMGNLKFDIQKNNTDEEIQKYKEALKTDRFRVFTAASTHTGEDEIILSVYKKLKSYCSDAKLLIAPRHPERFNDVYKLIKSEGFSCGRFSEKADFASSDVILLDAMGVLSKLFAVSYTAFIGGSFSKTGGHNPLEALIWGIPVISGADVFNFKDVYNAACGKKAAVIVNSENELASALAAFYDNQIKYKTFSANASAVFEENRGALNYVLERI